MPCYSPLFAFRSLSDKTESGKSVIKFRRKDAGNLSVRVTLPCGQCIGCRIERSRQWAVRCINEASLFENNCFITLTFDDSHLDPKGSLVKSDFQKFMKRLRKACKGIEGVIDAKTDKKTYPIRYFHCGEYGDDLRRPHHHACLFNFDFADKTLWTVRKKFRLYRSELLERLWPFGHSIIGDVTYQSAAYVARYITKKITGDQADDYYKGILAEYVTMSRRPGIGKRWFERFVDDIFPKDFYVVDGKRFKSPKYYDKLYDSVDPENFDKIRKKRLTRARLLADDNNVKRLAVKRVCAESKVKTLERTYEDDNEDVFDS